jgi:hypothetical protein
LSHLSTNIITLSRQARYKHEKTLKQAAFLAGDGLTESALIYNPDDPHATYGGDNLFISPCGPQDQVKRNLLTFQLPV